MAIKEIKKELEKAQAELSEASLPKRRLRPDEPRTKELPFDTEVPGDRGDCEKESTTQGSE